MRVQIALISAVALLAACSNSDNKATTEGGGTAAPATPAAATMPAPKPGLWQQTISGGAMPAPTTVKMCVGPTVEGENPFSAPQPGVACSENSVKAAPGGAEFHSVCNAQGMTVTSDGKVSGNMDSAYKIDITTKTTGPNVPPQMAEMKMTIDATRLGDCPAGTAPGAVVQ
ncbi:DUF3617 family protein [Brevundimonas sp.]|uniref:DUF3617 domain-containing protein n=1 Tax=Brevundimonas sp. TaxID=1871086 RepID=UPI0025B96F97|nr:DUF3617 family protein [Brevundimonas sp.]